MRRIKTLGFFFAVIVTCAASIATAQEEQWLGYHSAREAPRAIARQMRSHGLALSNNKPAGVRMPEFESAKPFSARWSTPMVKSGHLWVAFDRTHSHGPADRLFIDSDADGHLDDETAVEPYLRHGDESRFGPVKMVFEGEDGPITYHLNFEFELDDDENRAELKVGSGGWYEGPVTVGQEKKHCVLIDRNANGTFDDKSLDPDDSDRILLGETGRQDIRFVGNYLQTDNQMYRLEVAQDGVYVKLSRAENVTFGNILLPASTVEFSAGGQNGLFTFKPEKGRCKLPVGKYRIAHWAVERRDEKGKRWRLESRFGGRADFNVSEADEIDLKIGELVIRIPEVVKEENNYNFYFVLQGRMGERLELTCNDKEVKGKLRIENKEGTFNRTFEICVEDS
jgi:hypothetical protein